MKILAFRLPELQAMVAKFNKKATKWGLPQVSLLETERGFEKRKVIVDQDELGRAIYSEYTVEYVLIDLEGETPRLSGWAIHSKVEPSDIAGQNFVFTTKDFLPVEMLRTKSLYCDHCQSRRLKKKGYWIEHEDGRQMMVGATCLQDFLPAVNVDSLIGYMNQLSDIEQSDWDDISGISSNWFVYSTDEAIQDAYVSIRKYGYTSKRMCEDDPMRSPTSHDINASEKRKREMYQGVDMEVIRKELEGFKEHILAKSDEGNDFLYNVKLALKSEMIKDKLYAYIAAAVNMWIRDKAEEAGKASGKPSRHVGVVGARMTFTDLTVLSVIPIEGTFGATYLYMFKDTDGNKIKWFSSRHLEKQPGEKVTVVARVKAHDEFRGEKQTTITRGSIV